MTKKLGSWMNLAVSISMVFALLAFGLFSNLSSAGASPARITQSDGKSSFRLIVQLKSPPAVEWAKAQGVAQLANGRLDFKDMAVQSYVQKLKVEQAAFVSAMKQALPQANVGQYINEFGQHVDLTYQVVYNGVVVEPGMDKRAAAKLLMGLPGVKGVWEDYAHDPEMYASLPLINAVAAWNNVAIGGKANAGAGVKIASMDGGIYGHLNKAPMFNGTGYSYPPGYPAGGLGLTDNNNGKVILSRVYFRSWDPPAAGEENAWPGPYSTPHGGHTSGTIGGNEVVANYEGITVTLSGVAPRAWLMSYRVFYNSVTNDGSFYNAEGIKALEDIALDGADVQNNSWGGGPFSRGNDYDPLDEAINNTARSGVFESLSAGNAGPEMGTLDHPGDEYITVGASSTAGTYIDGSVNIVGPQPIVTTTMPTLLASGWGPLMTALTPGTVYTWTYKVAENVNPANKLGCNPWPAGTFTGVAAVIERGTCEFGTKALEAQNAGAAAVVIFNSVAGGNAPVAAGPGAVGASVSIPVMGIGRNDGLRLRNWQAAHPSNSQLIFDFHAVQWGNVPDVMASFSSRGPGANMMLKPDITAPGVNILSQGYAYGATGEDIHWGFGQASGTSMASPHVAGSAALLHQIHPDWPNWQIKSALMTSSKYIGIYNGNGSAAQPLDMGAGRLDLTNAADPGVVLAPQSASFGLAQKPAVSTLHLWVTSVANATETYNMIPQKVSAAGFGTPVVTTTFPGLSISPLALTLGAGQTAMITVTFVTTASGVVVGDNQGWVLMDGPTHDAHFPVWARVVPAAGNEILVIDRDAYNTNYPLGYNYQRFYTAALDRLGKTYDIATAVPSPAVLANYKAVIFYTGVNWQTPASYTTEQQSLVQYANAGGKVLAMGQDLYSWTFEPNSGIFFYDFVLGGNFLQDNVATGAPAGGNSSVSIVNTTAAPKDLLHTNIDTLSRPMVAANTVVLSGANEVPPVTSVLAATADFYYFPGTRYLEWTLKVSNPLTVTSPATLTGAHIHLGAAGVNGGVYQTIFAGSVVITDTPKTYTGSAFITAAEETTLLANGYYVNIHSTTNPTGDARAQVVPGIDPTGDGYDLAYMDEISYYDDGAYTALFQYPGAYNVQVGTVSMAHAEQPTLEKPGLAYAGRSIYTTFGLENVNNGVADNISRENLLNTFLNWLYDAPTATISQTLSSPVTHWTSFKATLGSNIAGVTAVAYRWDFGDGTPFTAFDSHPDAGHTYQWCGWHTVRVEVLDSLGHHVVYAQPELITACSQGYPLFVPFVNHP